MAGSVGSQGSNPQCTFLSISSRKPKVRPHHFLFEKSIVHQELTAHPLWWAHVHVDYCVSTYTLLQKRLEMGRVSFSGQHEKTFQPVTSE